MKCPACPDPRHTGGCAVVLKLVERIERLEEQNRLYRDRLRYQERSGREAPFGSSTPSSKRLVKANSTEENHAKKGGAAPGHEGHFKERATEETADAVEEAWAPATCPCCHEPLEPVDAGSERTLLRAEPTVVRTVLVRRHAARCPRCGKLYKGNARGALPGAMLDNRLASSMAYMHYAEGATRGHLSRLWGIAESTLESTFERLADVLEPCMGRLLEEYRAAPVKHADESGWSCDGHHGHAWDFVTPRVSLFSFPDSRRGEVAAGVFGPGPHAGVLVTDRYGAYNKTWTGDHQYCFAHLLRLCQDVGEEHPEDAECQAFRAEASPLVAAAITLRNRETDEDAYRKEALRLRDAIMEVMRRGARHPAVQHAQDAFRDAEGLGRLFHWCRSPDIPADNNAAERGLRPMVIARKVSFGSQSERGLKRREILMSVFGTLRLRTGDPIGALVAALDRKSEDPEADIVELLFGPKKTTVA
jgi:hypothetical protein